MAQPPIPSHSYGTRSATSRLPNRRERRTIAQAFKAILKGNLDWPTHYRDAMSKGDAKQWESAMQKEYDSIIKNNMWKLVPRPTNAKVIKSHWVYPVKDGELYKAWFCTKGFTQRWGEDYHETFAPV